MAGPEIALHVAADRLPASHADLGIDASIGDDLDVAVGQQQIDQHTIVVGGVPDAQMREQIERALARRLIAKQRRAVERAFDDKADLAGMGGLAGLDRLLDTRQHAWRKYPPHPPVIFDKMLADAFDLHVGEPYLPASRSAAAAEAAASAAKPSAATTRTAASAPAAAPDITAAPATAPDRPARHKSVGEHRNDKAYAAREQRSRDRSGDEPGDDCDDAAGRRGADQPAQYRSQETAEDHEPDQRKRVEQIGAIEGALLLPMRRLGRRQGLAVDHLDHPVDPIGDAAGKIT